MAPYLNTNSPEMIPEEWITNKRSENVLQEIPPIPSVYDYLPEHLRSQTLHNYSLPGLNTQPHPYGEFHRAREGFFPAHDEFFPAHEGFHAAHERLLPIQKEFLPVNEEILPANEGFRLPHEKRYTAHGTSYPAPDLSQ